MKSVLFGSYGGPEVLVLKEVPCPWIGAGEVLIRVHAAGVNPFDWKVIVSKDTLEQRGYVWIIRVHLFRLVDWNSVDKW